MSASRERSRPAEPTPEEPRPAAPGKASERSGGGAGSVAAGILASRFLGFVREAALAFYFGVGPHADVFRTALRGPNILQNLLGEQTLSAAFIPIYSRLLAEGKEREAGRFAGAIFGLLLAVAGVMAGVGVLLARPLVAILSPGYLEDAARVAAGTATVDRFPLAVTAVKILFPMTGILVLSAWALGVLNSHRRFFLPYFAPVLWNATILAALWEGARLWRVGPGASVSALDNLLIAACFGALIGGLLQFLVQLPLVVKEMRGFRLSLSIRVAGVGEALRATLPLVLGRGVVQLTGFLDLWLASLLAAGAQGSLGWAQTLYLLPVSLFGMSIAASELPELARLRGTEETGVMITRVERAIRSTSFLTVPTAVGYLAFGFLAVGGLFRHGSFGLTDNWLVYLVLAGFAFGLTATNSSRQFNNLFYAHQETKIPARIAVERVAVAALLGASLMFWLDRFPVAATLGIRGGSPVFLGATGLGIGAGVASWVEFARLRQALARRHPSFRYPLAAVSVMVGIAALAVVPAGLLWWGIRRLPVLPTAILVLGCYALCYLAASHAMGIPEAREWSRRLMRRLGRGSAETRGEG